MPASRYHSSRPLAGSCLPPAALQLSSMVGSPCSFTNLDYHILSYKVAQPVPARGLAMAAVDSTDMFLWMAYEIVIRSGHSA